MIFMIRPFSILARSGFVSSTMSLFISTNQIASSGPVDAKNGISDLDLGLIGRLYDGRLLSTTRAAAVKPSARFALTAAARVVLSTSVRQGGQCVCVNLF